MIRSKLYLQLKTELSFSLVDQLSRGQVYSWKNETYTEFSQVEEKGEIPRLNLILSKILHFLWISPFFINKRKTRIKAMDLLKVHIPRLFRIFRINAERWSLWDWRERNQLDHNQNRHQHHDAHHFLHACNISDLQFLLTSSTATNLSRHRINRSAAHKIYMSTSRPR